MYQGNCISDWAVVPVTAVELAWCFYGSNYDEIRLSAQDLRCNCTNCHRTTGNGCMGGYVEAAINLIVNGFVAGGSYDTLDVNTRTYQAPRAPQNYVDCLKYWSNPCDPSDSTNCKYEMYDPALIPATAANSYCPTQCNRKGISKTVAQSKVTGAIKHGELNLNFAGIKAAFTSSAHSPIVAQMELYEDMDFFFKMPTPVTAASIYRHTTG